MNKMENLSRLFQKQKREKKTHEEIEFHNAIKTEFLLPCTGCRKIIEKIPE